MKWVSRLGNQRIDLMGHELMDDLILEDYSELVYMCSKKEGLTINLGGARD